MRRLVLALLPLLFLWAQKLPRERLEAIHAQRVEWMKIRAPYGPPQGIYQDFRAAAGSNVSTRAAKDAGVDIVFTQGATQMRESVLYLDAPKPAEAAPVAESREIRSHLREFPDEVLALLPGLHPQAGEPKQESAALRVQTTHILARELSEAEIRQSLAEGRTYTAHDWLCDPAGFTFAAANNLGIFDIGDRVPMQGTTRLEVRAPLPATIKLFLGDTAVEETSTGRLSFAAKSDGAYRAEAWLTLAGEQRLWISTSPLHLVKAPPPQLPPATVSENVEVQRDIPYLDDGSLKHKLDLYLPKDRTNFPVLVFVHGGSWRSGDRSMYTILGNRFAKNGIGVAIPSYRLMPANPHPAQVEDAAAAFAWVWKNIGSRGGDRERIYLGGHSAGGHLVSLLALHPRYLANHEVPPGTIKGVASLSGVYDVKPLGNMFGPDDPAKGDASPIEHVRKGAPKFLITYCQWDYLGLPLQARRFTAELKKSFVEADLVYIPGENHISEMLNIWKDDDPTALAVLKFILGR